MRKIKWFQDPDQFYAIYNQLMSSRPKLVLSAHLFYSLPLEDTVYKSVCGQVPGLSDIIERDQYDYADRLSRGCRGLHWHHKICNHLYQHLDHTDGEKAPEKNRALRAPLPP